LVAWHYFLTGFTFETGQETGCVFSNLIRHFVNKEKGKYSMENWGILFKISK
jgi:hypothetical protein